MTDISGREHDVLTIRRLPQGMYGRSASGWWGAITFVITEGALFAYLLFSYYYFAVQKEWTWLPDHLPGFQFSGPNTAIVLLTTAAIWFALRGALGNSRFRLVLGLSVALLLGCLFVALQLWEWSDKAVPVYADSYTSLYYILTGFHLAHVVAGVFILLALTVWGAIGYFDAARSTALSIALLYWVFVDLVWLAIFFTIYVTPYLGLG